MFKTFTVHITNSFKLYVFDVTLHMDTCPIVLHKARLGVDPCDCH